MTKVDIMNMKIKAICFIILLFLLIGVASAAESNETLQQAIEVHDEDICQSIEEDTLKASTMNDEKLEMSTNSSSILEKSSTIKRTAKPAGNLYASLKIVKLTKVTLKAPDVKMHYNQGSKFIVTLKDSSKKAIKKAKVQIRIDNKLYTKTTDSKGKASITLNLKKCGTYKVTSIFSQTNKYKGAIAYSTVTVKSTIKSNKLTKYYKNKAAYYSIFYDKKGKLLKNTNVKFKLDGKIHTIKTNKKGVGKLNIDLKPGMHGIESINTKTSETTFDIITIKSILETKDLTMNESDKSKFSVKVLNSNGKVSPNKKVILKVDGKSYTIKSNSQGIATQIIDLPAGSYSITTEYEGLINTNKITVNKGITHTPFSHITSIPNYANVTFPYVFHNSAYSTKTGSDGIIRMPKNELFTVQINDKQAYQFSQAKIDGINSIVIGYKTHFIPFDGSGIKSDFNKENLKGNGILISTDSNYTHIEFRNNGEYNTDLFGIYMDKFRDYGEIITYIQNNNIKAKIYFYTVNFDEMGLKYNLGKFYGKSIYDFNYKSYEDIIGNDITKIKFANTGEPVNFSYFGKSIVGYESKEDITTKFIVNGKEELEKRETISYGLSKKYRSTLGFEVLQTYAILNEKITYNSLDRWISKSSSYLNQFGIMNVYGMFLAGLETTWLADEIAENYAKDFNVKWNRGHTLTVMGGINLDDTYLHILNADMGMDVFGNTEECKMFRLINSIYLPNIEQCVLNPVGERYWDNISNSLDNVLDSIEKNNFSIVQMGDLFYLLSEDGKNTSIIINATTGIANVILVENDFAYKGAIVPTTCDCCSVGIMPKDIIKGIKTNYDKFKKAGGDLLSTVMGKINPLAHLAYYAGNVALGVAGKLVTSGASLTLFGATSLMLSIHATGNYYKNNFMDQKDWHWAYKHVTFTRDGFLQNKKFFNIPKSNGDYDFIEVEIKSDGSLDRNHALYVGDGYTKKLSKSETYKYFSEEKWTPYNIPKKYQKFKLP